MADLGGETSYTPELGGIVLFIDDEPAVLCALLRVFAPITSIVPLIAPSGDAALAMLKKFPVDAIVTDQRMPGITGNGLLAACRHLYPSTARILLTAFADRQTVSEAAVDAAVDLVFAKPWDEEALKNGVVSAIAKAGRRRRTLQLQAWAGRDTDRLQNAAEELVALMEAHDPQTALHSLRAAEMTRLFDDDLGLGPADIYVAALLHDVGALPPQPDGEGQVDDGLPATSGDGESVNPHPVRGETMVLRLQGGTRIAPWIRHHHERYDGTGFPDALRGTVIPLGARVIRVVDAAERLAMDGMKSVDVLQAIMQGAGMEFDPRIAKRFVMRTLELAAAGKACR
jgi:response regulator RpfG family c-di-GMP phosphodiesterase